MVYGEFLATTSGDNRVSPLSQKAFSATLKVNYHKKSTNAHHLSML